MYFLVFSEPASKKEPVDKNETLSQLKSKVYQFLKTCLEMVNVHFLPMHNKYSPKVSVVQSNLGYHPDNSDIEREVEMKGYLNCHLCLNAQTQMDHTEPDASYTIILVPNKIETEMINPKTCRGGFKFIINDDNVLVVPMNPGLILIYSGFMLTHRQ